MDFIEELRWRGLLHTMVPGTQEKLREGMACGYVGFDPTAPSLQLGNLAAIMLLVHFQRAGHKPLALVGGATGMIGDPSGKSEERVLMSPDEIRYNLERFTVQLRHFLDFDCKGNNAEIVNNYDWFADIKFLEFLRDTGKHLTLSYMIAKDSVQTRLETGISFTEFSYQLLQAYDFYWLNMHKNCILQLGGSDQWGNITSGTELIRRKSGREAFGLTCPLVTRADGTKFGKSAAGEKIWLDPSMTSPYKFYQFWINSADDEAVRFLKIFTLLSNEEISALEREQAGAAHERPVQKALAREVTVRVHSEAAWRSAVDASEILFGKGTTSMLGKLSEKEFLDIFEGVPRFTVSRSAVEHGVDVVSLLAEKTAVFTSKGEARRMIQNRGVQINKIPVDTQEHLVDAQSLLKGRYLLVQKGRKNYVIIEAA
jgi:tyrosyl-tRNA synthetase